MKHLILSVAAFGAIALPMAARAESFDNDSIIALTQAGVGDDVLITKINNLPCAYNLSTDNIIVLKKSGVSNNVLSAMVLRCSGSSRAQGTDDTSSDPLAKRTPGLYIQQITSNSANIKVIRPTIVSGVRISGNGSILFPLVAKLSVPQSEAQTTASISSPVFYFYFESADNRIGDFGTSSSAAAQSPSEFGLVRFKMNSGQREMTIGKVSGFNARVGIDPKNTIPFSMSEIGDGIFEVKMNSALQAGQYAFVLKVANDSYRVYDFQVK